MAELPNNFPFPAERDKANNIKVRADHFDANMAWLIQQISNGLSRFGANKMQGNIDANNKTFKNLASPIESGDAATKQYVDSNITNVVSRNPLFTPALLQLATQDETLAGAVTNKAVSPATLALAISSAISASSTNLPYGFLGGFALSYANNTQITIGDGQCTDSSNTRNMITRFTAKKDILTLWAPSNGTSNVVGCRPAAVPINLWSRYNIFAISTEPRVATRGTFTTPDISANVDNFKGVSDGFLRVVIDGINYDLENLNFSLITTVDDIALVLKEAITGADVNVGENNVLIFTSGQTGATSSVNLATVPGATGTDITTTQYLDVSDGIVVNGENYKYAEVDFGIDQGNNYSASNLLAVNDSAYQAGYRNYRYIGYLVVGANNAIISITGANDEAEFNKARESRTCSYRDFANIMDKGTNLGITATNFWTYVKGYLPANSNVGLGAINGQCFAYWGSDGVRRFMLPDFKLRQWLGGWYGVRWVTDSITGQQIELWLLPGLMNNQAFRRASTGGASDGYAANIGTLQYSGAPNIVGSCMFSANGTNNYFTGPVNTTGAFYTDNAFSGSGGGGGSGGNFNKRMNFNAARTSVVYQDGLPETRPVNYSCHVFIAY